MELAADWCFDDGRPAQPDQVSLSGNPRAILEDEVRRALEPTPCCVSFSGVCFSEERSWYAQISGRRNLEFFAALHGLRRLHARSRVEAVLREVGLAEAADRPFSTYSTGMRLRLALGRALLHEPRFLLLDEPTRSLDPGYAHHFVDRLLNIAAADGRAIRTGRAGDRRGGLGGRVAVGGSTRNAHTLAIDTLPAATGLSAADPLVVVVAGRESIPSRRSGGADQHRIHVQ